MDGKYYIKLCEKGQFLHNKSNISLIFNTDGAPLYSSSSVSLWPVFLAVNELPSPDRFVMKVLMNNTCNDNDNNCVSLSMLSTETQLVE